MEDPAEYLAQLKLAEGDHGPVVAEVRDRLSRLGLLAGDVGPSDRFDAEVQAAVRHFQQQRGLTVDGIVGPQTFRRLEEARWNLGDRVLAYSPGHLTAGDDVIQLQRTLERLGFGPDRVDGVFDAATDRALREFQRNAGLEADGVCGPEVWRAFDRLARSVAGGGSDKLRQEHAADSIRTGVTGRVVVIDPGHGGPDYGEIHHRLAESIVADDLARRVEGRLAAIGTQVLLSRPMGHYLENELTEAQRARFANENGADVIVSLHVDAEGTGRARGVATYYFGSDAGTSLLGQRLAQLLQIHITRRTDLPDCRTHPKTWDLLRLTRMPAVRVECGYLTNEADANRLTDAAFRDALADGVAQAVIEFFAPRSDSAARPEEAR